MMDFFEGACIIVDVHIRPEAVRKLFRVRRPLEKGSESQVLRDFNTMQLMYDGPRDRCYLNIGRGEKPCGTATSGKVLIGSMDHLTGWAQAMSRPEYAWVGEHLLSPAGPLYPWLTLRLCSCGAVDESEVEELWEAWARRLSLKPVRDVSNPDLPEVPGVYTLPCLLPPAMVPPRIPLRYDAPVALSKSSLIQALKDIPEDAPIYFGSQDASLTTLKGDKAKTQVRPKYDKGMIRAVLRQDDTVDYVLITPCAPY
jgi:hypothetical protein